MTTKHPLASESVTARAQPVRLRPFRLRLSLRMRTLLLVGATLVVLLALLFIPLRSIVLENARAQEREFVEIDVRRAIEQINTQLVELTRLTSSYANWDDSYLFVTEGDGDYLRNSHDYNSFVTENRDLVQIVDNNGGLLLSKAVDPLTGRGVAPPRLPEPPVGTPNPLYAHTDLQGSLTGIIMLRQGPLLFSSNPIVRSDGSGPAVGSIIFGRFLNAGEVATMAAATSLALEYYRVDAPALPADIVSILPQLRDAASIVVRPLNEERVAGYALLNDFFGKPALVMRVDTGREIYRQGEATIQYVALALLIAGLVFGLVILLLLERTVLSQVARLSLDVQRIGASGDVRSQVQTTGDDELGRLAQKINEMLIGLEQAQLERQQAAEERLHLQDEVIQTKRHLISRVSHELRTPLTPIKGFVDLLLLGAEGQLTDGQRQILDLVRSNADRMALLVDDLLDLGRAEAGSLNLHLEPIHLAETISRVVALFQHEIARKALRCTVDVDSTMPMIEADKERIAQVLVNLISNAVKYTFDGGVVSIRGIVVDADHMEVQVSDTGVGITLEQQQQLFTPFYRADSPLHTTTNGTGLGLLIARTLIEQHQGSLYVRSEQGKGSTFGFVLPIRQRADNGTGMSAD